MGAIEAVITAHTLDAYPALGSRGFSARQPVRGPEWELVTSYVEYSLPPAPRGQARTIFIEPRIASGFPDIVVVYWHVSTAQYWPAHRADLTSSDIKVLHFLVEHGSVDHRALQVAFPRNLGGVLDRLLGAGLIRQSREVWHVLALKRIFAVRRLIAIEAKVSERRLGLAQALRNTWFASESYLLLDRRPLQRALVREAADLGVGLVTADEHLDHAVNAARREALPKSYVSWFFNEWAWRASFSDFSAPAPRHQILRKGMGS